MNHNKTVLSLPVCIMLVLSFSCMVATMVYVNYKANSWELKYKSRIQQPENKIPAVEVKHLMGYPDPSEMDCTLCPCHGPIGPLVNYYVPAKNSTCNKSNKCNDCHESPAPPGSPIPDDDFPLYKTAGFNSSSMIPVTECVLCHTFDDANYQSSATDMGKYSNCDSHLPQLNWLWYDEIPSENSQPLCKKAGPGRKGPDQNCECHIPSPFVRAGNPKPNPDVTCNACHYYETASFSPAWVPEKKCDFCHNDNRDSSHSVVPEHKKVSTSCTYLCHNVGEPNPDRAVLNIGMPCEKMNSTTGGPECGVCHDKYGSPGDDKKMVSVGPFCSKSSADNGISQCWWCHDGYGGPTPSRDGNVSLGNPTVPTPRLPVPPARKPGEQYDGPFLPRYHDKDPTPASFECPPKRPAPEPLPIIKNPPPYCFLLPFLPECRRDPNSGISMLNINEYIYSTDGEGEVVYWPGTFGVEPINDGVSNSPDTLYAPEDIYDTPDVWTRWLQNAHYFDNSIVLPHSGPPSPSGGTLGEIISEPVSHQIMPGTLWRYSDEIESEDWWDPTGVYFDENDQPQIIPPPFPDGLPRVVSASFEDGVYERLNKREKELDWNGFEWRTVGNPGYSVPGLFNRRGSNNFKKDPNIEALMDYVWKSLKT